MSRSVIVSAVRTPFGRLGSVLSGKGVTDFGAVAIRARLERAGANRGQLTSPSETGSASRYPSSVGAPGGDPRPCVDARGHDWGRRLVLHSIRSEEDVA